MGGTSRSFRNAAGKSTCVAQSIAQPVLVPRPGFSCQLRHRESRAMRLLQTVYAGQRAPQVRDQKGGSVPVKMRPLMVKTVHFCLQLFAPGELFCLWPPFLLAVGPGR